MGSKDLRLKIYCCN